jgi:hypothetical protein
MMMIPNYTTTNKTMTKRTNDDDGRPNDDDGDDQQ